MTERQAPNHLHGCSCGCGETANAGRHYRPGHDARHAKNVFVAAMERRGLDDSIDIWTKAIRQLPTEALRQKFRNRMRRFATRDELIAQVWELEKRMADEYDSRWMNVRGLLTETDPGWESYAYQSDRYVAATAIAMGWSFSKIARRRS